MLPADSETQLSQAEIAVWRAWVFAGESLQRYGAEHGMVLVLT